jgi:hypothetical protein
MVVLVAGCLPGAMRGLPASFEDDLRQGGWAFTVATPGPDAMSSTAVVTQLRGRIIYGDFLTSPAIPVFGVLDCEAPGGCRAPRPPWGDKPGSVWLVLYPDSTSPSGDISWALVDGVAGFSLDRYMVHRAGDRP